MAIMTEEEARRLWDSTPGTEEPAPATSAPEPEPARASFPSADVQRTQRLVDMLSSSIDSYASFQSGEAQRKGGERAPGVAQMLADRSTEETSRLGVAGPPAQAVVPQRQRAALERELLRRGLMQTSAAPAAQAVLERLAGTPDNASIDLDALVEAERQRQAAEAEDFRNQWDQAGKTMSRADPRDPTRPYSPEHDPILYPLRGIETLLRAPRNLLQLPSTALHAATGIDLIPGVAPSFRVAEQRGQDPWTAYLAAMDPLGRFTSTGQETGRFTNDDASYQDVLEKALPHADPTFRTIAGFAADIGNDPLSFTAFPKVGGAARIAGSKTLGAGLERLAGAGSELAGRAITAAREASPVADDFARFLAQTKTALSKATWDKYADLRELGPVGDQAAAVFEWGENATRAQQTRAYRDIERILGRDVNRARDIRDYIEDPSKFSPPGVAREPYSPPGRYPGLVRVPPPEAPPPAGQKLLPAPEGGFTPAPGEAGPVSSPGVMFGAEQAAPTAVPGTPDAARYGAMPNWSQARDIAPEAVDAAEKIRLMNQSLGQMQVERGILGGMREGWWPHEMSRETRHDLGKVRSALDPIAARELHSTGYQHQRRREFVDWLNGLIGQENAERGAKIMRDEGRVLRPDELIPPVKDTTVDVNNFMAATPEPIRKRVDRMGAGRLFREQAEFYADKPEETLKRAHARGIKAFNDYDTMEHLAVLQMPDGKPMAIPGVFEKNGRVYRREPIVRAEAAKAEPLPALPGGDLLQAPRPAGVPPPLPKDRALGKPAAPSGAFEGTPAAAYTEHEVEGYRIPRNADFRRNFPDTALPNVVADHVDKLSEPYWRTQGFSGIFERYVLRPVGHTGQQFWKTAATVARPAFGFRNYYSQQIMNIGEYGARAVQPWVQSTSHKLALGEDYFARHPEQLQRKVTIRGNTYTYGELRAIAENSGLWRNLRHGIDVKPMGSTEVPLWSSKHPISKLQSAWESKPVAVFNTVANPFSEKFFATRGFAKMTEFFERQGRMAGLLLELERGKGLVDAAVDANKVAINYGRFGKDFEKYVGAVYPFGKWTLGQALQYPERVLRRPGPGQLPGRLLDAGRHMVPEEERRRFDQEPTGGMAAQMGAELVGWPGVGALKEPEAGQARGPYRLPYLVAPPEPSVTALNWWGSVPRVLAADDKAKAIGQEYVQGMFPLPKSVYERVTGQNVWTNERIDPNQAVPAPRMIEALVREYPWLKDYLAADYVQDPMRRDEQFLAVPRSTAWWWRTLPNVQAMDLLLGAAGEGERPYDNQTAMILRSLGLTHIMHDPLRAASEEARDRAKAAAEYEKAVESWGMKPKKPPSR